MIIKQTVIFNASPHELYEAIIDAKKHSEFTGAKATNNEKVGGKFTSWDGYAFGKNLVLQKDKKIVQSWSTADFPEIITEITFEFEKQGNETKLIFYKKKGPQKKNKKKKKRREKKI